MRFTIKSPLQSNEVLKIQNASWSYRKQNHLGKFCVIAIGVSSYLYSKLKDCENNFKISNESEQINIVHWTRSA